MSASPEKTAGQIRFEIGQIDQLRESFRDLLDQAGSAEPSLVEITALASVLHSFYNGIENLFLSVAKNIDHEIPEGPRWHADLLMQMVRDTDKRGAVIPEELQNKLAEYLAFRHFYRHSYSFRLDWGELEKLVGPLPETWSDLKRRLESFLADWLGRKDDDSR